MAVTDETSVIETVMADDVDACLALSREAGWNQAREDWLYFLTVGTVFGVRDDAGRLIATAALMPAPPVTWISMVLVTQRQRRRGLADGLMRTCIGKAHAMGLEPWLDATPAGATVYARMGFVDTGYELVRMRRDRVGGSSSRMRDANDARLSELVAQDRDALGFDRAPMLTSLARRAGSVMSVQGGSIMLLRDGDRTRHIGPMFAPGTADAIAHLDRIVTEERGPLLIDLSSRLTAVTAFLERNGFAVERPFTRMRLGHSMIDPPSSRLIAACGPEFG